jgi:hypothetical protein
MAQQEAVALIGGWCTGAAATSLMLLALVPHAVRRLARRRVGGARKLSLGEQRRSVRVGNSVEVNLSSGTQSTAVSQSEEEGPREVEECRWLVERARRQVKTPPLAALRF